jgi:hypothetical protein
LSYRLYDILEPLYFTVISRERAIAPSGELMKDRKGLRGASLLEFRDGQADNFRNNFRHLLQILFNKGELEVPKGFKITDWDQAERILKDFDHEIGKGVLYCMSEWVVKK